MKVLYIFLMLTFAGIKREVEDTTFIRDYGMTVNMLDDISELLHGRKLGFNEGIRFLYI